MWGLIYLAAICSCFPVDGLANKEEPVVTTSMGKIKGSVFISREGKPIYSFRGIRYGKAPVGELRFKPPEPVERYDNVFDATKEGPRCSQILAGADNSEDCLRLNVYTTKTAKSGENVKKPVIVYIHPGGFYFNSGQSYWVGPQYLLDQDIVLVSINFRLATLGLLSTGDALAPGNNALKDQVLALKWVKKNIAAFGGDPDNVVLMGYSAGGRSVILHLVSPMSRGLFHKAVAMSGAQVGLWPIPDNQLEIAKKHAKLVGCPDDTSENIIKCLRSKPHQEISNKYRQFLEFGNNPLWIWSPVIEKDFGQERFLTDNPIKLIMQGKFAKVPLMVGVTRDEFAQMALPIINNDTLLRQLNEDFNAHAPIMFLFERNTSKSAEVSEAIKKFYVGDGPVDKSSLDALGKAYADSTVGFSANRAAKLMSQFSNKPVYYYQLTFQGRYSYFYKPGTNNTEPFGIVHHDDLMYLFWNSKRFPYFNTTSRESHMVTKMTKLHGNFAKTGNPTPEATKLLDKVIWEPFNLETQKYLEQGDKFVMKQRMYDERYKLYEGLDPISSYLNAGH